MVSEVRFRDILCTDTNFAILSKKISQIIDKKIKLKLITKELPLPFDVVGLQLKYCDIVGIDGDKNIYIIELKRKLNKKSLVSAQKQVTEYVETLNKALEYIRSSKSYLYPHEVLIRYFEYMNVDPLQIRDIVPVIISLEDFDDLFMENSTVPYGAIGNNVLKELLKNYIISKIDHFINSNKNLINSDLELNYKNILEYAIKKQNINRNTWFPVVLSKTNFIGENKHLTALNSFKSEDIHHSYILIFENVNNFHKEYVDVTDKFESYLDDEFKSQQEKIEYQIFDCFLNNLDNIGQNDFSRDIYGKYSFIPELYYQFNSEEIFDRILKYHKYADSNNSPLKFTIQLFRSGRAFPIIYLQIFKNVYVPLVQIKPVVMSIGPSVNEIIATDMKEKFDDDNNSFYEDVISFDQGTYEIALIESRGVDLYSIKLNGTRNNYEFQVYSPKFRAVKELLPYMSPDKVKNHLQKIINEKGISYLFKKEENGSTEWITSKIHLNGN